jgi:hypothetical protein
LDDGTPILSHGSNRLAVLSSEIIAAHQAAERAKLTSLERAKEAGSRLSEAKQLLGHGNWLDWLKTIAPRMITCR